MWSIYIDCKVRQNIPMVYLTKNLIILFTPDKPIIFNFHGYPWLIHKLAYRRTNQERIHVRGYKEQGNINTPLELAILNQIDRFNLVIDVIDRVETLGSKAVYVRRAHEK